MSNVSSKSRESIGGVLAWTAVVTGILTVSLCASSALAGLVQADFLVNPAFDRDLEGWSVNTIEEKGEQSVSWSAEYDGSARLYVSGGPGVATIAQNVTRSLRKGERIHLKVHHTDQGHRGWFFAGWNLMVNQEAPGPTEEQRGPWRDRSRVVDHNGIHSGEQDEDVVWTVGKDYPVGSTFGVQVVVWPGKFTVWLKGVYVEAQQAPPVPKAAVPPRLAVQSALADGNSDGMLNGGEQVSLTVRVANSGEGSASGVVVKLSGSSKALQYLGTSQTIGDIGPGETREAKFETVLPNRIDVDNGSIVIHVSEANGFDALEEKELIVAMQPAKVTRETQVVSTLVDVDAPLEASGYRREDAYAVVVGISGYRSDALPKVTYAKKDAEIMKDYLVGVCGFKTENVKLLVDDGAAFTDLTAYCEEWLTRNVRKGSFVFVYFAGHGTPSPDKGEAYLVPYDGEPGFVSKLYPLSRLYSSLAALPTDQVVVALDACFSGAGGRSVMEQGKRPLVAVDLEKEAQKLGNVAVLTASAGNEISQDYDAKRHGLFTYYLLKGLRGEADADKDGWVTVKELYDYAKPKVLDESRRLGYDQTMQFLPQPTGSKASVRVARTR